MTGRGNRLIATAMALLMGASLVTVPASQTGAAGVGRSLTPGGSVRPNPVIAANSPAAFALSARVRPSLPLAAPTPVPDLAKLPLQFEPNVGQAPADVRYFTRWGHQRLLLTDRGAIFDLRAPNLRPKVKPLTPGRQYPSTMEKAVARMKAAGAPDRQGIVHMRFVGGSPMPPVAEQRLRGVVNYFKGRDAKHWQTKVPTFARVRYRDVYPGIDVVYRGNPKGIEYDFVLAPGADPRQIRVAFDGAENQQIAANGDLLLTVAGRVVRQSKPEIYQDVAGTRRPVSGRYLLAANGEVGFEVGAYLASLPLVIDPVSLGNGGIGEAEKAVSDTSGNSYVTGIAPGTLPAGSTCGNAFDAFVVKLDADNQHVWTAYLGGRDGSGFNDCSVSFGIGIALHATTGDVVVAGATNSSSFVVTDGTNNFPNPAAFQQTVGDEPCLVNLPNVIYQANGDAFVARLQNVGATGVALVYSTYLGGNLFEQAQGVVVDSSGNAYVTGGTQSQTVTTLSSAEFNALAPGCATQLQATGPDVDGNYTIVPTKPAFPAAYDSVLNVTQSGGGFSDLFVAKVNPTGSVVGFLTLQGGTGDDAGLDVSLNALGEVVVAGDTLSVVCTDSACAPQVTEWQRQLGIDSMLAATDVPVMFRWAGVEAALTAAGCESTEGGVTFKASDFAGTDPATQTARVKTTLMSGTYSHFCDPQNAVLTKFSTTSGAPTVPPFLVGGSSEDQVVGIGVDASNNVYVAGHMTSQDFRSDNEITAQGAGTDPKGKRNAFLMKVALPPPTQPTAAAVPQYASSLGGSEETVVSGLAVTPSGTVYLAGTTNSTDAVVVPPATTQSVVPVLDENGNPTGATEVVVNPQAFILQIPPPATSTTAPVVTTENQLLSTVTAVTVASSTTAQASADGVTVTLSGLMESGDPVTTDGISAGDSFKLDAQGIFVPIASVDSATTFTLQFPYPLPDGNAYPLEGAYTVNHFIDPPKLAISADADGNVIVAGAPQDGDSLGIKINAIKQVIDVKPKSKKNNINLKTKFVRVAIISTPDFDAVDRIDQTKPITFGATGDEESFVKCGKKGRKVNKDDKLRDLVCTFRVSVAFKDAGPENTVATLKAKTKANADYVASDAITIVPPKKNDKAKDFHDDDAPEDD